MDLSLRTIVQSRYGIARGFSVIRDVLSKLNPEVNYHTADGKVSLRLILTPPRKPTIVSFTGSGIRGTNEVSFTWHVDPPTPWLLQNTQVSLFRQRPEVPSMQPGEPPIRPKDPILLPITRPELPLSGSYQDTVDIGTTIYQLKASVVVQAGTLDATSTLQVTLAPPPGPTAVPSAQAATLNGDYTVAYTSSRDPVDFMLTLSGTLVSAQGAAVGQSSFSQTIPLMLPPAGDVVSQTAGMQTIPFTVPNLRAGTWNVTATSKIAGSVQCSGVSVPGYLRINGNLPDVPPCQ